MRRIFSVQWVFAPSICVLAGLSFGATEYFSKTSRNESVAVSHIVRDELSYWLLWAALSPLILMLARRFPLERPRLRRGLAVHLAASVFCAILSTGLYLLLSLASNNSTNPQPNRILSIYSVFLSGIIPNVVVYWAILAINLVVHYQRQYKNELLKAARLDAQLSGARLDALKMQLQPHFLFNTLHSVTALVLKNENRDAVKMINRLSEFLRLTLDSAGTQTVTLKEELEFADSYLAIELIRFQDRLTVARHVESRTLDAEVPNLILQPLVENAVRHGTASHSGPSRIEIVSRLQNGLLYLEVRDEGGGNSNKSAAEYGDGGIGLKNTRARLRQLYGDAGSFKLLPGENAGTTAQIIIPFVRTRRESKGDSH